MGKFFLPTLAALLAGCSTPSASGPAPKSAEPAAEAAAMAGTWVAKSLRCPDSKLTSMGEVSNRDLRSGREFAKLSFQDGAPASFEGTFFPAKGKRDDFLQLKGEIEWHRGRIPGNCKARLAWSIHGSVATGAGKHALLWVNLICPTLKADVVEDELKFEVYELHAPDSLGNPPNGGYQLCTGNHAEIGFSRAK